MKFLLLALLAIAAYFYIRYLGNKGKSDPSLPDLTSDNQNKTSDPTASGGTAVVTDATDSTGTDGITGATAASSAVAAESIDVTGRPASGHPTTSANAANFSADSTIDSGDLLTDIQEMLKILNLRESDSPRLAITKDEFNHLKSGQAGEFGQDKLRVIADRLKYLMN